eukprot:s788_g3.t1
MHKERGLEVRTLSALTSAPLICDGDTGFGGLLNVDHTVKGYEAAGAAAIQLEARFLVNAKVMLEFNHHVFVVKYRY